MIADTLRNLRLNRIVRIDYRSLELSSKQKNITLQKARHTRNFDFMARNLNINHFDA